MKISKKYYVIVYDPDDNYVYEPSVKKRITKSNVYLFDTYEDAHKFFIKLMEDNTRNLRGYVDVHLLFAEKIIEFDNLGEALL